MGRFGPRIRWIVTTTLLAAIHTVSVMTLAPVTLAAYQGGTVTVSAPDPETLDPAKVRFTSDFGISTQVFEGLVEFNPLQGKVVPCLAESWDIANDGREYAFHLKQGVKFHNGKPFNSGDVRNSLERFIKYSQLDYLPDLIRGGVEYKAGKTRTIEGVATPDPITVKITLTRPVGFLLPVLASVLITPEEIPGYAVDWKKPPGTGPFTYGEWKRGNYLELLRNPSYHQPGFPYLDKVRISTEKGDDGYEFTKGGLSAAGLPYSDAQEWMSDDYYRTYVKLSREMGINYINLNTKKAPFNNKLVRQALNLLLNPAASGMQEGAEFTRLGGLLSPDMPGYLHTVQPYPFDIDKAKALLSQAGYKGGTGIPKITLLAPNESAKGMYDLIWGENLTKAGIKYASSIVSFNDMDARIAKGDYIASVGSWAPDYADPDAMFHSLMHPSSQNCIGFSSPEITALIEKGRTLTDAGERKEAYDTLQTTVRELAPMVFGWSETRYGLVDPTLVGWEKSPSSDFPLFKYVWSDRPRAKYGEGVLPPAVSEAMRALGNKDWNKARHLLAEARVNYQDYADQASTLEILISIAHARAVFRSGVMMDVNPDLRRYLSEAAFEEQFLDLPKGTFTMPIPDFVFDPVPWENEKDLDIGDKYNTGLLANNQREFIFALEYVQGHQPKQLTGLPPVMKAGKATVKSALVYRLLAETFAQSKIMPDLVLWLMDQAISYAGDDKTLLEDLKKQKKQLTKEVAKW